MPARFRLWDNEGRSVDRYTVVDSRPCQCEDLSGHYRGRTREGVGFSRTPYHPQGVGLSFELDAADWAAADFRKWGRRIRFDDLPPDGKILVGSFLLEREATQAQAKTLGTTLAEARAWAGHHGSERWMRGLPPKEVT